MTTIIIITILLIVLAIITNTKSSKARKTMTTHSKSKQQPSSAALETAHKYFYSEWHLFVQLNSTAYIQPNDFHETIALALEKLSSEEHKKLLLTFIGVNTNSSGVNNGVTISVGLNNYKRLH